MLKKNDEALLTIDGIGTNMEGVARYEGFVCFVPFALKGEQIRAKILQVKKDYCYAKVLEIIRPSPYRIPPVCRHFQKCGGCSLQHISYEEGLQYKLDDVKSCFSKMAGQTLDNSKIIGLRNPLHYRNKAIFPISTVDEKIVFGYYQKRSHRMIQIEECPIVNESLFALARAFTEFANFHQLSAYDETKKSGLLRHILLRIGKDGKMLLHIVTNGSALPKQDLLVKSLSPLFPKLSSISYSVNTKANNTILGEKAIPILGKDSIEMELLHLSFDVAAHSFFQVNQVQFENILRFIKQHAKFSDQDILYDIYCGAGSIGLSLASSVKKVIGIEVIQDAVDNANNNAKKNHITNSSFYSGEAEHILPALIQQGNVPTIAVIDPPRKGCDRKVLNTLFKNKVSKLIYISCHPASQARDFLILKEMGYELLESRAFDMFCYTSEIENVLILENKNFQTNKGETN